MAMFSPDTFKAETGKPRTQALFIELSYDKPTHAVFTLKEDDHEHNGTLYLSLHKLFVSMVPNDPSEYEFAMTVFGSWDIWENLCKSPRVKAHIAKWRAEAHVKIKSQAIQAIAMEMKEGGRSSFSAAKLLLEKGWLDKDTASQAKKKLQAKEREDEDKQALAMLSDDAARLGIKVN